MNETKRMGASREELRDHAVNELVKRHPKAFHHLADGGKELMENFIKAKLYNFPKLCEETRRVNYLKLKQLKEMGNPQGWSQSKEFKLDYVIPRDLYLFMVNMVYRYFWDEENEKIWRSFMRGIMRGDDPMGLLRKVKVQYGQVATQVV